jgi:hypothetical protein
MHRVETRAIAGCMKSGDDYQSSDDLIRQARSDLEASPLLDGFDDPDMVAPIDSAGNQELVRPADRISSSAARPPPPEVVRRRPPPPTPQPVVAPAGTDPKERRHGRWLAMLVGVVLLIAAALTLLTFVSGLISSDPEVTENVIGFVILLAMLAVPGAFLLRWARRR